MAKVVGLEFWLFLLLYMASEIMLSVIYLPIEEAMGTKQLLANQTLQGIEIVELKNCSELEMLYKFKDVLPQVNGKYVTIVCEGDEFGDNYFEKMINRMEKKKAKVAVARKLAITMLALWRNPEVAYDPHFKVNRKKIKSA